MKNRPCAHYCSFEPTPETRYLLEPYRTTLEQLFVCTDAHCIHGEWKPISPKVVETDEYKKYIESKRFKLRVKLGESYRKIKRFFSARFDHSPYL